jgi:hypothetical protein
MHLIILHGPRPPSAAGTKRVDDADEKEKRTQTLTFLKPQEVSDFLWLIVKLGLRLDCLRCSGSAPDPAQASAVWIGLSSVVMLFWCDIGSDNSGCTVTYTVRKP